MSTISVILATYNGTDLLDLTLSSLAATKDENIEVVIADDGSTNPTTQAIIEKHQRLDALPILHAKQEDLGFRLARSRNNAASIASGDILAFLDHDILVPKNFFKQVRAHMTPGWFAAGRRVKLDRDTTEKILTGKKHYDHVFAKSFACKAALRKLPGWRYLFPTRNRTPGTQPQPFKGMSGFCIITYRKDFLAIDGFDNTFTSYGVEDWDFLARLNNNGTHGGYLPTKATTAHLWHKETEVSLDSPAYLQLNETIKNKITQPKSGFKDLQKEIQ
ncbi:glycosyltransferase [Pelagicoccus sp. SDUM812005]|uniref:glycosyltransferase n=1 Tax=Pelagicoccus sp. SDUM812005 TaxID=3041257 RepID=UPI00280D03C2|nr:glycosyltransferase [Pelagicoccus sp. SDUM812005]MDQ8183733.1 glycosyltransferase [Pelagicoccus sp. SDUM812005]